MTDQPTPNPDEELQAEDLSVDEVLARLNAQADADGVDDDDADDAQVDDTGDNVLAEAADVLAEAAEVLNGAAPTEQLLAERTDDLQRLQAEYANYRKRVERDKALAKQKGIESVIRELMPVLDAIATAQEHEALTGGFKVVVAEFTRLAEKLGLKAFGAVGDLFDPNLHEALMQMPSPTAEPGSIAQVIQLGYQLGEVVLRPARVAVVAEAAGDTASATTAEPAADG